MAVLGGVGDLVHTLVEQPPDAPDVFLPGLGTVPRGPVDAELGLADIDHFASCVRPGEQAGIAAHYQMAWGFERIRTAPSETDAQLANSEVVAASGGGVVLTLVESAGARPRRVDHFLRRHGGPGVRHMALRTEDIVATVGALRARGVQFRQPAATYYAEMPDRVAHARHELSSLSSLGIMVEHDRRGDRYQISVRSSHPRDTYTTQIIERDGAATFDENNVKAVLEANRRGHGHLLDNRSGS